MLGTLVNMYLLVHELYTSENSASVALGLRETISRKDYGKSKR